jgi:hypothetical protein
MGLVLVFDLDQTIIDSSGEGLFNEPDTLHGIETLKKSAKKLLNFRLVNDVIQRAAKLRGKKDSSGNDLLSGIFLLTNNSSKIMVSSVDSVLHELVKENNPENPKVAKGKYMSPYNTDENTEGMPSQAYFFDSIMMRQHPLRTPSLDKQSSVKNLNDVKNMLGFIGVTMTDEEIQKNTFFFDDLDHPGMTLGKQYIKIRPPFKIALQDQTNYEPVLQRLSELDGQPMTPSLPEPDVTPQESTVRPVANKRASILTMFPPKPSPPGQSQYRPRPGESMANFMKRMGLNKNNTSGGRRKTRLRRKNSRNKSRKRLRK